MSNMWSEEEDLKLLDGILECGFGNWERIRRNIPNRDASECERHYLDRFIKNPVEPELKQILECHRRLPGLCGDNCSVSINYDSDNYVNNHSYDRALDIEKEMNSLDDCTFNPWKNGQPVVTDVSSLLRYQSLKKDRVLGVSHNLLAGYNPNRSEFEVELDDKAEGIVAALSEIKDESDSEDETDREVCRELRTSLVHSYNFRLSERCRKKQIIRRHALLDRAKSFSHVQRYETLLGRKPLLALLSCLRFISGPEADFLLESLKFQRDLKVRMNRLCSYRRLGIKYFEIIPLYEKLYRNRMKYKHELEMNISSISIGTKWQKRASCPLDIHNLPCYAELEDEEKELCSVSRIVPETYLSFKSLMIQECHRLDGLKLLQARPLFKIDVNKTRKMYDYLILKKLIWLPKVK